MKNCSVLGIRNTGKAEISFEYLIFPMLTKALIKNYFWEPGQEKN